MRFSDRVKPISYFKAHAPEMLRNISERREPVVITLRGEAKAVPRDVASYEQTQETLALLKMLAIGNKSLEEGKVRPVKKAFARVRKRVKT